MYTLTHNLNLTIKLVLSFALSLLFENQHKQTIYVSTHDINGAVKKLYKWLRKDLNYGKNKASVK